MSKKPAPEKQKEKSEILVIHSWEEEAEFLDAVDAWKARQRTKLGFARVKKA
jgi:hypothetical protein